MLSFSPMPQMAWGFQGAQDSDDTPPPGGFFRAGGLGREGGHAEGKWLGLERWHKRHAKAKNGKDKQQKEKKQARSGRAG